MIKSLVGQRLDGLIHRLFPILFWRRLDPNSLTVSGCLISLAAAAAFGEGWLRAGGVLILLGGFFDLVDGVVARHQGSSTRFGGFLDSTLDRLVDLALLVGLRVHIARLGRPDLVLLVGVTAIACALVSYAKARAELDGVQIEVGILERGERIGLLAAGAILGWMVPALVVVAIGSIITVIQRVAAAHQEFAKLEACGKVGQEAGGQQE